MIIWSENLYVEDKLQKKIKRIRYLLENRKITCSIYCVAKASNANCLYDIIEVNELLFQYYERKKIEICAIASSYEAAVELVQKMILEMHLAGKWDDLPCVKTKYIKR